MYCLRITGFVIIIVTLTLGVQSNVDIDQRDLWTPSSHRLAQKPIVSYLYQNQGHEIAPKIESPASLSWTSPVESKEMFEKNNRDRDIASILHETAFRFPKSRQPPRKRKKQKVQNPQENAILQKEVVLSSRQETTSEKPELTSVSPLEASFGGLTGIQGLPDLSVLNSIKLLVALFPFMLPLIFVPLLIFSIGIFMIPIYRKTYIVDDNGDPVENNGPGPGARYAHNSFVPNSLTRFAIELSTHEMCVERISCETFLKFAPSAETGRNAAQDIISMVLGQFSSNVTQRVTKSITETDCTRFPCRAVPLFWKILA